MKSGEDEKDRKLIDRAQTTFSYLSSKGGKLTSEQSARFIAYLMEAVTEEDIAWQAAKWYQRLWYRCKLVYWKIRGWERTPFNVKVYKFKSGKKK